MSLMEHYILSIIEDQLPKMRQELGSLVAGNTCVREFQESGNSQTVTQRWVSEIETVIRVYEHLYREGARKAPRIGDEPLLRSMADRNWMG